MGDELIGRLRTIKLLSQRNQCALQNEAATRIETLEREIAVMRGALGELVAATGPHSDYCSLGPLYNCNCDVGPAHERARQALNRGGR